MRRYTHIIFGVGLSISILSPFIHISYLPIVTIISGIGSVVPDLDTRFRHRKALHNILSLVVTSIVVLIIVLRAGMGWVPAASYALGYISHIIGDLMTKRGVAILYPFRGKYYRFPVVLGRSEDLLVNVLGTVIGIILIFFGIWHFI
ncbi:MAG: metal-dependent hydrolase [Sulfolobales archaeon]